MEALLQGMLEMGVGQPASGNTAAGADNSDEDGIVFEGNFYIISLINHYVDNTKFMRMSE